MAIVIDLATRRRFETPTYAGFERFMRFMEETVGAKWYVSARACPACMGDRPHTTRRRYSALEAEYRRRFGAIHAREATR